MSQASVTQGGSQINRRRLFRWALLGTMGAIVAQAGLGFTYFFYAQKTGTFGGVVRAGNLKDFPVNSVTRVPKGKYYLTNTDKGIEALFWRCRHLGCTVPWNPNETYTVQTTGQSFNGVFHCPCHGSVYSRDGQIRFGPAPGPLDIMKLTIAADGGVDVDTGAILRRSKVEDTHFVPAQVGASGPSASTLAPHDTGI